MNNPPSESGTYNLRPYTITELAGIYKVCRPTMRKWLRPFKSAIGERIGHFYSIVQVKIIFDKLGVPDNIDDNGK